MHRTIYLSLASSPHPAVQRSSWSASHTSEHRNTIQLPRVDVGVCLNTSVLIHECVCVSVCVRRCVSVETARRVRVCGELWRCCGCVCVCVGVFVCVCVCVCVWVCVCVCVCVC